MSSHAAPATETCTEAEILLCCASACADSERARRLSALFQEDVDWLFLLWKAIQHGMMPLLYWHLNALCPDSIPKAIMSRLRGHFDTNARRNLLLTGELLRMMDLLSTHGIYAVPYKGPILAASIYGNLALRQAGDLDIVIPMRDVLRVKELLMSEGYRPDYQLAHGQETVLPNSQYALYRDDCGISLEIHWQFAPKYLASSVDLAYLSERLRPMSLGGVEIQTLSPEDLLLILCIHGGKHMWEQLRWICDIAKLIHVHQEMDWEWVTEQASHIGCGRMLLLGLLLANDLLGATLPEPVLEGVWADSVARSLVAQVRASLFSEPDVLFRKVVFHLRMMDHLWDRARYCLYRAIPVADDRVFLALPQFLSCIHYLLRPIRLLRDHRLRAFQRF
jgi:hypothetical protein